MPRLIFDEFTHAAMSPQRRYQKRKEKANKCRICGQPGSPYCKKHLFMQNMYLKGRVHFELRNAAEQEVI